MGGKTSAEAKNRYNSKTYDRIAVVVPKGEKEKIKEHSESYGYKSVNELICRAIRELMERDIQGGE